MSGAGTTPFLEFLRAGIDRGGFEADDALATLLPLLKQALATHERGLVAPLDGLTQVSVGSNRELHFAAASAHAPRSRQEVVERLQDVASSALDVVGHASRTADIDAGSLQVTNLDIGVPGEPVTRPVYLTNYTAWEHAAGHHDELTDIFSLGMLLGSVALGLDFTDPDDLEAFVAHRDNLFAINSRLNPVIAGVIAEMTTLNRHRRTQDLTSLIHRLEHYREQASDFTTNLTNLKGFKESSLQGKRALIQSHLRDRLFEISRRNRLIYFKPTLQTLNLTVASVPLLLDYRNIRLEQLFVWHQALANTVSSGAPISLGKYLRFEDAPYIPGTLDKIISEVRRDRAEYGFAQLRLVLCFLRWNNLKEAANERIVSPLLLLPVELTKKKGVRDNYVLEPSTSEAEINPALRHHLKELYNLRLPETVDLKETTLEQLYETLKAQIQASEPGVTLQLIDRPQIELIHERARQRVDQYQRRLKTKGRLRLPDAAATGEPGIAGPLGLRLFLSRVRPSPAPLRDVAGAPPVPRPLGMVATPGDSGGTAAGPATGAAGVAELSREMFALRDQDGANPYAWDFDLCNLTLGNFNYRKMTLVRDYANLMDTDVSSAAFDTIFSLTPRAPDVTPSPIELRDQHLIIACDAAQASAIARARSGSSYIIQGPPGTGKSQTITNLIADYIARGKRVLFVCEKRAAIDIVFHRLRQQGLDELCCLIHDSQADKKAFIQNLKQTYERFLDPAQAADEATRLRAESLTSMDQDLASLRRFSEAMQEPHPKTGVALRALLHRLIQVGDSTSLSPELSEVLPHYPVWMTHGSVVGRLERTLSDLGETTCFAKHPSRWLAKGVLQADRPLEAFRTSLDQTESLLDEVESTLELSGLPAELWDTLEEIHAILDLAARAKPLAERGLLTLIDPQTNASSSYSNLERALDDKTAALARAEEKTVNWKDRLSPDDTRNALALARGLEGSILRFLQPAYWRLRKVLSTRYNFGAHAVAPAWSTILGELVAEQEARAGRDAAQAEARREWHTDDPAQFRTQVSDLRNGPGSKHPSVVRFVKRLTEDMGAADLIVTLADIQQRFAELHTGLAFLLTGAERLDFAGLTRTLSALRELTRLLPDLLPVLADVTELPESLSYALRHVPIPLNAFEAAIARKSLQDVYREDRALQKFDGRSLASRMGRLSEHHRQWLSQNADCIRSSVRRTFLEHVNVSSLPAAQLDAGQKLFKKQYAAGRRELEHEFGKTMRYKSIRDLAAGQSGRVIQDLKPVWLMSPLSVSDTLPLDPSLFDVVIFDEASQIPVEDAIPAVFRSNQVIVVGDEMQLPPTTFFAASRGDDESVVVEEDGERIEVDLDSDSFLTQSARNLPSTLLAWHYRSRHESLISFSNAAFYSGNLFTIPDRRPAMAERRELRVASSDEAVSHVDELLARSVSFHFMEQSPYHERRNAGEAAYMAHVVRELLRRETGLSIGVVAFSQAQQDEIEEALSRLAESDAAFANRLEAEYIREENDQFCGLFVKNLENVQGDERDIILLSICYGRDAGGRMLMNFGPINQRGGEKRLNVIFSRAKHHMAVVSSIRHQDITNSYNDGANSLKQFLQYAEAASKGDATTARRVLEGLNPLARKSLAPLSEHDAVVDALARALQARGYGVDLRVGQSKFRCDLAVRTSSDDEYRLGVLIDTDAHYANPNLLDRYLMQPSILQAFGWQFALVLTKDWLQDPEDVLLRLERMLTGTVDVPADASHDADSNPADADPVSLNRHQATAEGDATAERGAIPVGVTHQDNGTDGRQSAGTAVRRFESTADGSSKFWEISVAANAFTVRFGRIGTTGQAQTKTFADDATAAREAEKLIAQKVKKGYGIV